MDPKIKEYSENTTEEIVIKDLAGNESKVEVKISNLGYITIRLLFF